MISNGTNEQPTELRIDDMLALMKQLEDMALSRLPKQIVEVWGREVALKLAGSAEGRKIGETRVFLPRGYELTGEMFLLSGDKLIHLPGSLAGPCPSWGEL